MTHPRVLLSIVLAGPLALTAAAAHGYAGLLTAPGPALVEVGPASPGDLLERCEFP